jgi:predicted dehydrogenase
MKKIGFIDYYLHEWHADNMPTWISEASNGEMKVCYAWGEIDSPKESGMTNKAWAEKMDIELLASQQEVIEKSDYLVVLSPDNSERHVELCKLPLVSGKPTYVDKTFAVGLDDAGQIVKNSRNTPFYSCSALRYDTALQSVKKTDIELVDFRGMGLFEVYAIHMLEPLHMLMGKAKRVLAVGNPSSPTLLYDYADNRRAVISFFDESIGFSAAIRYKDGSCTALSFESEYFKAFASDLVRFFKTGIPTVKTEDTLEIMSMLDSGRRAASDCGKWINVK